MNIAEFSVKNSILSNMLTVVVLVVGLIMTVRMQREVFPVVDLDLVVISTRYQNASPEEVEDLITVPLEDEIRDVDGIDEYTSTSVEGISVIVVQVDPNAKYKERVFADIQRKIEQITDLPEEADTPEVEVLVIDRPVIRVALSGTAEEGVVRDYGEHLELILEDIPGVSKVEKDGWRDEEFWVETDPSALEAQELSLTEVIRSLAQRNINRPGGKVTVGTEEILLRTIGQFYTADEIADVIVRSNSDGNHVRVKDVASVIRTYEDDAAFTRVNGHRAHILVVEKKESGDTVSIANKVKEVIAGEELTKPAGVESALIDDTSYYVKRRLRVLSSNGLIGMVLVTASLFVFMNFRVALVTAIGIPFSFLATLMIMSFFGVTINLMTMFGLIIVLGMVVDDAIIVGENIFRHMEEGMEPGKAAVQGTSEVLTAVTSTVLTTVAAFLPLMFVPDIIGKFLKWIPIVVMIALLSSLFEALVILPCHVSDFVRPLKRSRARVDDKQAGHPIMDALTGRYTTLIQMVLHHRYIFMSVSILVFVGSVLFAVAQQKIDMFPADLIDIFHLRVKTAEGTSLDQTAAVMGEIEKQIDRIPDDELDAVATYVGKHIDAYGRLASGSNFGQTTVYLTPQNKRERRTQDILNEIRGWCEKIDGIEHLDCDMEKPGPPVGKAVEVKVRGREFDVLDTIAQEIEAFLATQPGVRDVQDDYETGKNETHVIVDEQEAARLGLSVADVAQTVYAAFQGAASTIVREGKDEIDVVVKMREPYRDDPGFLNRLTILNKQGRLIQLGRVAHFIEDRGLPTVFHYDGDRVVTVSASIDADVTSSAAVNVAMERAFRDVPERYPGYRLIRGGEWEESRTLLINLSLAFMVAMLLIYTILAMQFQSFLQPFVVMAAIPFGIIGVILALYVHQKPISMMALMGMVGLSGVVVNDAIVLVTFINTKRREGGIGTFEAIVQSGRKRLRPILLTSLTTVAGLLPVIYGWGGYEPFIAPAAITLAYGLIFATVLTLLVVPCIYHIAFDVKAAVGRLSRRQSAASDGSD
ncbi:MAG: efflux RND transporter permease subunit [Verrucomicrobia bacterium]|nr:efflux RND transporter permease subunit [Verrucomicrobiota bacterium]